MSNEEWTWQFRTPAKRTYDDLDEHAQRRITDKLDEIVNDRWREPDDYLEPLTGAPHSKLRSANFVSVRSATTTRRSWISIRSNCVAAHTNLVMIELKSLPVYSVHSQTDQ